MFVCFRLFGLVWVGFLPGTKIKLESNITPESQIWLSYISSLGLHGHLVNKKHKQGGLGRLDANSE